jgi:ethanolamine utilization protein EutN
MKIAHVVGNIVSTQKDSGINGKKILLIQPMTPEGKNEGEPIVALDSIGAGYLETVLYVTSKEAAWPFLPESTPSDCTIIGIIDNINPGK